MLFFKFLNLFAIFLEISIAGLVGTYRNKFFFLFLGLSQLIFARKEVMMVFFNFLYFFTFFFGIFNYGSGTNSSERFFLFSLFLDLSQLILAGKVPKTVVFSFFNFFLLFFGIFYYESGRNSSEQFLFFLFFFFLSFLAFPYLFWLGKMQQWCFLIFLNIFAIFFNFLLRAGQELIGTIFFFSLTQPFPTYFLSFSAFPNIFCLEKKP